MYPHEKKSSPNYSKSGLQFLEMGNREKLIPAVEFSLNSIPGRLSLLTNDDVDEHFEAKMASIKQLFAKCKTALVLLHKAELDIEISNTQKLEENNQSNFSQNEENLSEEQAKDRQEQHLKLCQGEVINLEELINKLSKVYFDNEFCQWIKKKVQRDPTEDVPYMTLFGEVERVCEKYDQSELVKYYEEIFIKFTKSVPVLRTEMLRHVSKIMAVHRKKRYQELTGAGSNRLLLDAPSGTPDVLEIQEVHEKEGLLDEVRNLRAELIELKRSSKSSSRHKSKKLKHKDNGSDGYSVSKHKHTFH